MDYKIFKDNNIGSISNYKVTTVNQNFTFEQISNMVKRKDIEIPKIQRGFIWTVDQSSKFIESIIMGIPIPSFILYASDNGKFLVIDGLQRITSLSTFMNGNGRTIFSDKPDGKPWKLKGNIATEVSGKSFNDLSEVYKRKIRYTSINVIIFKEDEPSDKTSMIEVFSRINREGTPLTRQEIRNSVYNGGFNESMKNMNMNPTWRRLYGSSNVDKRMKDVEMLSSIFTMCDIISLDALENHKKASINKGNAIDNFYEFHSDLQKQNKMNYDNRFEEKFIKAMNSFENFNYGLSLFDLAKNKYKKSINGTLAEVVLALLMLDEIVIDELFFKNLEKLQITYKDIFYYYFREATTSIKRIKIRIKIIRELSKNEWNTIQTKTQES